MTNIQTLSFNLEKGADGKLDLTIYQDIVNTLNSLLSESQYYICETSDSDYGNLGKIYAKDFPEVKIGLKTGTTLNETNSVIFYSNIYINEKASDDILLGGMHSVTTNILVLDYFKTPDNVLLWGIRPSLSASIYLQFAANVPFFQIANKEYIYKDLMLLFYDSPGYGVNNASLAGVLMAKGSTNTYYLTTFSTSYDDHGIKYFGANSFRASSKGFELVPFALPSSSGSYECYSDKLYINLLGPNSSAASIIKSDGLYYLRLGHYYGFKIYYLLGPTLN